MAGAGRRSPSTATRAGGQQNDPRHDGRRARPPQGRQVLAKQHETKDSGTEEGNGGVEHGGHERPRLTHAAHIHAQRVAVEHDQQHREQAAARKRSLQRHLDAACGVEWCSSFAGRTT